MQFSNIIEFDPSIQILSDYPPLSLNNLQEIVQKFFPKPSEKIFSDQKKLHDYVFKKIVAACIEACQEGDKTEFIKKISFSVVGIKDLSGRSIFQAIIQDEKQLDVTRFLYKVGEIEELQTNLTSGDYQLDMQFAASKNRCDLLPLLSRIGNRMGH